MRVCTSLYEASLFHAAELLAFFAALRVSELVVVSKADTLDRALLLSDIQVTEQKLLVCIRRSKMD